MMNNKFKLKVRQASVTDISSIYEVNKACLPIYYTSVEHGMFIMNPGILVLVAEIDTGKNQKIVGYSISGYEGKNLHIMSIGVLEECRKKGIGKFLLKQMEKYVKKDCKTISLNVHVENDTAISFYKRNGFETKETLENYYDGCLEAESLDAYYMKKNI